MTDSPFNWQGKPSIFTTGKGAAYFNGVNTRRSESASDTATSNTMSLPNSSLFLPPEMKGPKRRKPAPKTPKGSPWATV